MGQAYAVVSAFGQHFTCAQLTSMAFVAEGSRVRRQVAKEQHFVVTSLISNGALTYV